MREIKFRGKTYQGKWIYGYCYKVKSLFDSNLFNWFIRNNYEKDEMIILETLGQYTGLNDKNGVEIYEGDIVVSSYIENEKHIVKFDEDRGGYYPFASGDGCGCCEEYVFPTYTCEVIGNIYDNKELLKEEGK